MRAGARPGQRIQFEGMRQGAVGERRGGRLHRAAFAQDTAPTARPAALGIIDDDAAPRLIRAANARRHGVGDAIPGAGNDLRRQVLIAERRGIAGECYGFLGHCFPLLRQCVGRKSVAHSAASMLIAIVMRWLRRCPFPRYAPDGTNDGP